MADSPRIDELRRRVEKDPASIAFAQLAEEFRRDGNYEDAIATCRSGLQTHPSYLSARVTLGRALIEVNALEEAETELSRVLAHAPENLAAIRGLAEIHQRRGELDKALEFYRAALGMVRHDPDLEQAIAEISRVLTPVKPVIEGLTFEQAKAELEDFLDSFAVPEPKSAPVVARPVLEQAPLVPHEMPSQPAVAATPEQPFDMHVLAAELKQEIVEPPAPEPAPALQLEQPKAQTPDAVFDVLQAISQVLQPTSQTAPLELVPQEADAEIELDLDATATIEPDVEPRMIAVDPALPRLERFLDAIHTYNQRRTA